MTAAALARTSSDTVHFEPIDVVVLVGVLGFVFVIGIVISWRARHQTDSSDFFLGGRDMAWWAIAGSLFASNIGTEHFIGMAGSGASSGLPVSLYEWTAGWLLVLLGELFAPVYLRAHVTTVPEFCEKRFGPGVRVLVSALSLIACIVTKISASIFAGGILLKVVVGWELWTSVPVIIATTGAYTVGGGLQAVMYTDVLQAGIFVVGGLAGVVIALDRVGGFAGMAETMREANLESHLHLLRPADDVANPSSGIFTGLLISSVWYWCIDQVIVQRVLSARSLAHARAGCVAAGYAKLLPPLMIVVPGIAARALFERCRMHGEGAEQADGGWCAARLDEPDAANAAYPQLILREFPPGMVGLMVAAMVCAMMSSLSSNFNSASTIFTVDVYHRFLRPHAGERELVWCGRIATASTCLISLCWLPVVQRQKGEFYLVVQNASSHIAPALATVVLLGILWPRVNGTAAFAGLAIGSSLGLIQYAVALAFEPTCRAAVVGTTIGGPAVACMHFLHIAVLLSLITLAVTVAATLLGAPPPAEAVRDTTMTLSQCFGLDARGVDRRMTSPHVQMTDHLELEFVDDAPAAAAVSPRHAAQSAWGANAGAANKAKAHAIGPEAKASATRPKGCVDAHCSQLAVHGLGAALIAIVLALVVHFR
jgi:SSS family transporter